MSFKIAITEDTALVRRTPDRQTAKCRRLMKRSDEASGATRPALISLVRCPGSHTTTTSELSSKAFVVETEEHSNMAPRGDTPLCESTFRTSRNKLLSRRGSAQSASLSSSAEIKSRPARGCALLTQGVSLSEKRNSLFNAEYPSDGPSGQMTRSRSPRDNCNKDSVRLVSRTRIRTPGPMALARANNFGSTIVAPKGVEATRISLVRAAARLRMSAMVEESE